MFPNMWSRGIIAVALCVTCVTGTLAALPAPVGTVAGGDTGGQSALRSVYTDPSDLTFRPWNRTWAASLDWQKDFWHVPEFFELLTEQQEEYTKTITGQEDAKAALDNIANYQEKLLKKDGLIK